MIRFREPSNESLDGAPQDDPAEAQLPDPVNYESSLQSFGPFDISFAEAFSTDFQGRWSEMLEDARMFWKGVEPGGEPSTTLKPIKELPLPRQVFTGLVGQEVLNLLRDQCETDLLHLRNVGEEMVSRGISRTDGKFADISQGVQLADGKLESLPLELVERLAEDYKLIFDRTRRFTWEIPDRELQFKRPKHGGAKAEQLNLLPSDRDRSEVYAIAFALGKLSADEFANLLRVSGRAAGQLEPFHRSISWKTQKLWAVFQSARGWQWRKGVEPGGTNHKSLKYFEHFNQKPLADQVFLLKLGTGMLDYLRRSGPDVIKHLTDIGKQIVEGGFDLEAGEFVNPLAGVPLIVQKDGKQDFARIDTEVLDDIAFKHHHLWLQAREWSWTLPRAVLHQQYNRNAHKTWDKEHKKAADWNPDRITTYGIAYSLYILSLDHPEAYQELLSASEPKSTV